MVSEACAFIELDGFPGESEGAAVEEREGERVSDKVTLFTTEADIVEVILGERETRGDDETLKVLPLLREGVGTEDRETLKELRLLIEGEGAVDKEVEVEKDGDTVEVTEGDAEED